MCNVDTKEKTAHRLQGASERRYKKCGSFLLELLTGTGFIPICYAFFSGCSSRNKLPHILLAKGCITLIWPVMSLCAVSCIRNRYRFWYLCTLIKIASDTGLKKHELFNYWQRNSCVNGHIYCIYKIQTRMKICWRHWRTKSERTFRIRQMWQNMAVTPLHASLTAQYKFWRKCPNGF